MAANPQLSEEALRLALEEQRSLLEDIDVIVWTMDPDTLAISYVTGALAPLGYSASQWLGTKDFFARLLDPEERPHTLGLVRAVAADGTERQSVHRVLTARGDQRWVRTRVRVRRAADGRVRGLLGLMLDITERRSTEATLRESEEHLKRMLSQLPALVWTTDRDLRFTSGVGRELANLGVPSSAALLGVSIQEYLNIVDPNDPVLGMYRRALEGESVRAEAEWMGRAYLTEVEPFRDAEGRIVGILAVSWNVTERKRAEERLQLLAEAGSLLAESLDYEKLLPKVAGLAVGPLADWCCVFVADEDVMRPVGAAHVDRTKVALLQELPASGMANLGPLRALLQGNTSAFLPEVTDDMIAPAGSFPLPEGEVGVRAAEIVKQAGLRSLIVTPLVARKQAFGIIVFARATPGRPYTSADLSVAEELARRCALAIDNARLYGTAQEAIDARDEFLSIASHELRTPLTSIQLRLESLERAAASGRPVLLTGPQGGLSVVVRQFKRLASLVEQLLDVSRIRRGALDLVLEDVDLAQVCREVGARFEPDLARAGGSLDVRATGPTVGRWDRLRIEQIVADLLSNAVKFARGTVIEVEVIGGEASARLVVRDRGMGISSADQARIFERFERAASPRHFGGLGLGLYIAKQIVTAHGGTIRLSSALGEGTTVVVELPCGRAERRDAPVHAHA